MAGTINYETGVIEYISQDIPTKYTPRDGRPATFKRLIINKQPNSDYPSLVTFETICHGFINTSKLLDDFSVGMVVKVGYYIKGSTKIFKNKDGEEITYTTLNLRSMELIQEDLYERHVDLPEKEPGDIKIDPKEEIEENLDDLPF